MSDIIKLEIPGKLVYEKLVREVTKIIASRMGFEDRDIEELRVAADEACSNAIRHGRRRGKRSKIEVTFNVKPGELEICVKDNGKGFDPDSVELPFGERLKCRGGRGIFIMKSLMDEVVFDSKPGGGTTVTLRKYKKT